MTEQRKNNQFSGVAATAAAAAVIIAGVGGYFTLNPSNIDKGGDPTPIKTGEVKKPPEQTTAKIYWLQQTSDGTGFEVVPQNIQVQADVNEPSEFLKAAFERLLAGPTEGSGSSTIPPGTKLLGIQAKGDQIRVNLSEDFQVGGGSASMIGRVGQVVYTATTLRTDAKVYLELNGEKVEVLGGEGLELQQPLTRDNFKRNFEL
ncbi:MAG: GerMN domain-containing protein [Cyanobacteria bacterium J06635_10]